MEFKCTKVSASEAGGEIFQILFDNDSDPEDFDSPYLLIQKAWLEEDEGESDGVYVECHEMELCGHFAGVVAELTRNQICVQLPNPVDKIIKVSFQASDKEYDDVSKMLAIILNK